MSTRLRTSLHQTSMSAAPGQSTCWCYCSQRQTSSSASNSHARGFFTLEQDRQIWVFGNPDKTELGFPDRADLTRYIANDIFEKESGRYRYTLARFANIIVMSRDGLAFGHFDVLEKVKPTAFDKAEYPKVKHVYLVSSSTLYEEPVPLSDLDIKLGRFGHRMSEGEFSRLLSMAGKTQDFSGGVRVPRSSTELELSLIHI